MPREIRNFKRGVEWRGLGSLRRVLDLQFLIGVGMRAQRYATASHVEVAAAKPSGPARPPEKLDIPASQAGPARLPLMGSARRGEGKR